MLNETERYEIIFIFTDIIKFTNEFVEYTWKLVANKVYERTGIFVDAITDERTYIVHNNDTVQNPCNVVLVMRNPIIVSSKEDFFDALTAVLAEVKNNLNNPYTAMSILTVEASFFTKV